MKFPGIPIAKAGWPMIFLGVALALAGKLFLGGQIQRVAVALGLTFSLFCSYFFRDPERRAPQDPRELIAPADGTVLSVRREGPGEILTVRIFLSIFNVHIQRAPAAGRVAKIHYQPGTFAMAMRPEAVLNERNVISLTAENGRNVIVEQIAGAIARKIACWVKIGDAVNKGDRIGMIYFGSQVALHLPAEAEILVEPGQKVAGGVTPVAKWTTNS